MKISFFDFFLKNIKFFFILTISIHYLNSFYGLENGGDAYIKIFFSNNFNFLKDELVFLNSINASHHISRWTLVLPLIIFSEFFTNPFYLNFVFSFIIFIISYFFVFINISGPKSKIFLILVILIILPFQNRYFSQPLTEYLSFTLVFLSCLLLLKKNNYIYISAILFFLSYGVKVTNLYFLPGIFFFLLLKNTKFYSFKFLTILFFLFLLETFFFNIIFSLNFGRLEFLFFGNHLDLVTEQYYYPTYLLAISNKLFFNLNNTKDLFYCLIFILFFIFNIFYVYKFKYVFFISRI